MTRIFLKLALGASLAILAGPSDVLAGRGGGARGGYGGGGGGMSRGGGGYGGGGGMSRGEGGGGGMSRGEGGGGNRQSGAASSGTRPSGQPQPGSRPQTSGGGNPYANAGNRNSNSGNAGAAAAGAGAANKNQSQNHPGGAAAGGAAYANNHQTPSHPAGAAAGGAAYANNNQSPNRNGAAAAGGAAYSNRNQPNYPNAGAAAGGAAYANRNHDNGNFSNAGAAAGGAAYANRNHDNYPNAGAAAVGAGYANRNNYDQYHPGMAAGYWNGNYGAWGAGAATAGVAAWGAGSPMYGYGYSGYSNPYGMMGGAGGGVAPSGGGAQPAGAQGYDYSQPLSTTAAAPEPAVADQATSAFDQARDAFKSNDYAAALQNCQQALAQMPNDATMHEFLGLVYFAQGKFEQAAGPLYAVLSAGPGWDWTTLIGNYSDATLYTGQLRGLEAFITANPRSAPARFVLAYHYITQGHKDAAADQLKKAVELQPNDTLSAQLLAQLRPAEAPSPAAPPAQPIDAAKLAGNWTAQGPQNTKITLSIKPDSAFTWAVAAPGKPPIAISGTSTVAENQLTLAGQNSQAGNLSGLIAMQDDAHFTFKATGAPASDPGLTFAR